MAKLKGKPRITPVHTIIKPSGHIASDEQNMDAAVPEAFNKGNAAAGIPVLEKALADPEGKLPPRK